MNLQRDIASTLDCIIDNIRWMKHYVEVSKSLTCYIYIYRDMYTVYLIKV